MLAGLSFFPSLLANQGQPEFLITPMNGLAACLAVLVSMIGVAVILWGAYVSVVRLIASETAAARGQVPKADASPGRPHVTPYLISGLDFILAGFVIKMSVVPDWQQAIVLAGTVLVRCLLGLSMKWEKTAGVDSREVAPTEERLALPGNHTAISNGAAADQPLVAGHVNP